MTQDFYTFLQSKKRIWMPVPIPAEPLRAEDYGVRETIERDLALGDLEMPVGAFIGEATRKELNLPPSAIALLKANIKDEAIHDRQLKLAIQAYPVSNKILSEVSAITTDWIAHPDHTLVKAKVLETKILMVAQGILRYFGGQALDRMASDISMDEWRHVQTNWSVCEELNLVESPSLLRLAADTLDWLLTNLTFPRFDQTFWRRQSDILYENGSARNGGTVQMGAVY